MNDIYIVYFSHKHGVDISAFKTRERAEEIAEDIRAEWHPEAATYEEIIETSFGEESVEILLTRLE